MEGADVSIELALTFITTVVTGLTSAVVYLFKLYYVDTKKALDQCKEEHKTSKEEYEKHCETNKAEFQILLNKQETECREELAKITAVVQEKQIQITTLSNQIFELAKRQNVSDSAIDKLVHPSDPQSLHGQ